MPTDTFRAPFSCINANIGQKEKVFTLMAQSDPSQRVTFAIQTKLNCLALLLMLTWKVAAFAAFYFFTSPLKLLFLYEVDN